MKDTGIKWAKILLPNTKDFSRWACIACDQFTSELDYWKGLEEFVGDAKSTLKLTFPEIYLEDNTDERIKNINKNIKEYIKEGVFFR